MESILLNIVNQAKAGAKGEIHSPARVIRDSTHRLNVHGRPASLTVIYRYNRKIKNLNPGEGTRSR